MALDLRLVEFEQELKEVSSTAAYDIVEFDGDVDPVLIKKPKTFVVCMQSGRAVGWRAIFPAPAVFGGGTLIGRPEINLNRGRAGVKWETTWSYAIACETSPTLEEKKAIAAWPSSPAMEDVT